MCFPDILSCPHCGYQEMPKEGQFTLLACAENIAIKHFEFQMVWTACMLGKTGYSLLCHCNHSRNILWVTIHSLLVSVVIGTRKFSSEHSCGLYATPLSLLGRR